LFRVRVRVRVMHLRERKGFSDRVPPEHPGSCDQEHIVEHDQTDCPARSAGDARPRVRVRVRVRDRVRVRVRVTPDLNNEG
jgi:hypothetical protein